MTNSDTAEEPDSVDEDAAPSEDVDPSKPATEESASKATTGNPQSRFVYVVCNPESQVLCKNEISNSCPQLTPSFSRPGFLTYKLTADLPDRFNLPLTFARSYGWSDSQIKSESLDEVQQKILEVVAKHSAKHIHVWVREWNDKTKTQPSAADIEIAKLSESLNSGKKGPRINKVTEADQLIVDVIRIEAGYWWIGWHKAGSIPQRWPGGIPELPEPEVMISRAYMKTCEGLMWSGINVTRGDTCAEIGSAPGGSCQRLLELGADVVAIDPADLHESIRKHKRLTHLKMRGKEVPHRSLSKVSWLLVDSNVTPTHALDTVEALSSSEHTRFRGLLLTLKFSNPDMVDELDTHVQRVKAMGYKFVKTRQLAYGRREIFLLALKQKSVRRFRG